MSTDISFKEIINPEKKQQEVCVEILGKTDLFYQT